MWSNKLVEFAPLTLPGRLLPALLSVTGQEGVASVGWLRWRWEINRWRWCFCESRGRHLTDLLSAGIRPEFMMRKEQRKSRLGHFKTAELDAAG